MKKIFFFPKGALSALLVFAIIFAVLPAQNAFAVSITFGDLIKASASAVYYYGLDGKRYVFPNEKTYKTWYSDFSTVKTITDEELANIQIGGNVTYRPGVKMVKIQTDPKVYVVSKGGVLRWVKTEIIASIIYGVDWSAKIDDAPDAFFTNYTVGSEIALASDYSISSEINSSLSINSDKRIGEVCSSSSAICGPLFIMNYFVSNISSTGAKIKWQTNWLSKGELQYGVDTMDSKLSFDEFLSVQEANLFGLAQNTVYKYKIVTEDVGGAKKETAENTFRTSALWVSRKITDSPLYRQKNPSIAASSDGFGVVWTDNSNTQDEIKFGVLGADGDLLRGQFILSFNNYESITPSIAWSGLDYGAVWEDDKTTEREIYFERIDIYGNRPQVEKTLTNKTGFAKNPKIVWNGENYGVFWWDSRTAGDINFIKGALYFQKMDKTGVVSGNNLQLATALSSEFKPDTLWGNNEYAAVWADNRNEQKDIYFIRIDETGNIQGRGEVQITNTAVESDNPVIVWDGINYGIVFEKEVPNVGKEGMHSELYYQKVNISGQKAGESVRLTNKNSGDSETPKIAKNGNKFGIVWADYRDSADKASSEIYFMEIDIDGKILTAEQNVSNATGLSLEPSIAVSNGQYCVVYTDTRNGDYEIYSARSQ